MRLSSTALLGLFLGLSLHCSSGSSQTGLTTADLDGGVSLDGSVTSPIPSTCAEQAPQVASGYCTPDETLYVCDMDAGTPPSACKRSVLADGYCCPRPKKLAPAYLLVCGGLESTRMSEGLRFYATESKVDGKLTVTISALKFDSRKLTKDDVTGRSTEFVDAAPKQGSFTSSNEGFVVPGEASTANRTDLEFRNVTLFGTLPLGKATLKGFIERPSTMNYESGCKFLEGNDGDEFTVSDSEVKLGTHSAVPAEVPTRQGGS
ncbi:MAG: hypothetical protein U0174_15790 [Polyangiaceae bacterium]